MNDWSSTFLFHWSGQCLFFIPSQVGNSVPNRTLRDPKFFGPLAHALGSAIFFQNSIISSVYRLFTNSGPSAIPRLIVSVYIYAINAVFWAWGLAHVSVKSFKTVRPTFADLDASASVMFPPRLRWIAAPRLHPAPCHIWLGFAQSMLKFPVSNQLGVKAPTGFRSAFFQRAFQYRFGDAAITPAIPPWPRLGRTVKAYNRPPSKLLPRQILGTIGQYNTLSHHLLTLDSWLGLGSCLQHGSSLPPNYTRGAL